MTTLEKNRPQLLACLAMPRFGRADEVVIGEIHACRQVAEIPADTVGELLRRDVIVARCLFHLLTMLVGSGQEHDVETVESLETRQHVTGKRGVSMTDVRLVIYIIDRRRNVETPAVTVGHAIVPKHHLRQRRFVGAPCRM